MELKTLVLNINPGHNTELMEKCRTLHEYMLFVSKIRKYRKEMPLAKAMEQTVAECIKEDILADFLRKNRAEVIKVGIYEYDEELHIQQERADAKEEGIVEGKKEGIATGILQLLEDLEAVPGNLRETIMGERDMEVLTRWLRQAARTETIKEFREMMYKP